MLCKKASLVLNIRHQMVREVMYFTSQIYPKGILHRRWYFAVRMGVIFLAVFPPLFQQMEIDLYSQLRIVRKYKATPGRIILWIQFVYQPMVVGTKNDNI